MTHVAILEVGAGALVRRREVVLQRNEVSISKVSAAGGSGIAVPSLWQQAV